MTYPDDVLKAAEEIALGENWANAAPAHFNASQVRMHIAKAAASRAIMAERQRCAEALPDEIELFRYVRSLRPRTNGHIARSVLVRIKQAILGQQEGADAGR